MTQGPDSGDHASRSPKRFKIYQEDAKLRQTSHWDWDYLSSEQLEQLAATNTSQSCAKPDIATRRPAKWRLRIVGATLATVGLIVGSLFVAV
jgi:hypothetical protein